MTDFHKPRNKLTNYIAWGSLAAFAGYLLLKQYNNDLTALENNDSIQKELTVSNNDFSNKTIDTLNFSDYKKDDNKEKYIVHFDDGSHLIFNNNLLNLSNGDLKSIVQREGISNLYETLTDNKYDPNSKEFLTFADKIMGSKGNNLDLITQHNLDKMFNFRSIMFEKSLSTLIHMNSENPYSIQRFDYFEK